MLRFKQSQKKKLGIFTGQKNDPKLAKVHFGQQLQFSFSIHNSDHVWESFNRKLFQSLLRALKSLSRPEWNGKTTLKLSALAIKTVRELRGLEAKHLFYDIIRITRHGSRFWIFLVPSYVDVWQVCGLKLIKIKVQTTSPPKQLHLLQSNKV